MNRILKRTLSLFLAVIMAVLILPTSGSAQATSPLVEEAPVTDTGTLTTANQSSCREVVSLREESVKHFDMGNGTFQAVAYGHPVHELDENGQWQDIDFSLSLNQTRGISTYTNDAAGVAFPASYTPNQSIMTMTGESDSISMTLITNTSSKNQTRKSADTAVVAEVVNPKNSFNTVEEASSATFSSSLVYEEVFPDVNLEYTVEPSGVKENIVVNTRKSNYCYSFRLELNNLVAELEGGAVAIYDSVSGELRYAIPNPIMYDAAFCMSEAVSYTLTGSNGSYILTVTADEAWVNEDERVFPVKIDPTVVRASESVQDTYIDSDTPNEPRYLSPLLWVRSNRITYIKDMNFSLPAGATLQWANLQAYYYYFDHVTTGSVTVGAYQVVNNWSAATQTWRNANNHPNLGISSTLLSQGTAYVSSGATVESPKPLDFSITAAVSNWIESKKNNENTNFGIALKYLSGPNLSVVFKSYETGYIYRPRIIYSYSVSHYFNALVSTYCFSADDAARIIDLYERVEKAYPNNSVVQNAWRSTGILGAFNYPTCESNADSSHKILWDQLLGDIYSGMDESTFFEQKLDYSKDEYELLYNIIRDQHKNANSSNYGDFSHMQASLSARLADHLDVNTITAQVANMVIGEDVSYLAGWLGDCVIDENNGPTLKQDDYIADLDAENIYRMIIGGQDIVSAASLYYDFVLNHSNRAIIFQSHINYETVKSKIYYYLIDIKLLALLEGAYQANDYISIAYYTQCLESEEYHQNILSSERYTDVKNFLQALAANQSTLNE